MNWDQELYKVCPECAGEYRPEIELCADCGVPLVHPEEIAFRDARELPLRYGLFALRTAPIAWVRALAQDLAGKSIPYAVDRRAARSEGLLTLYVRREDRAAAEAVDAARKRIEAPRYPEEEEASEEPAKVVPIRKEEPTYKVCPRCGGEYRLEIESCADCGVALVLPEEGSAEVAAEDLSEEEADDRLSPGFKGPLLGLPASDDLVCVCCRSTRALQRLSRKLDTAGIAHRLDSAAYGSLDIGCVYVLPADGDSAAAVDAEWFGATPIEDVDPAELTVCPACGTPHALGARECAGCGLGLGSDSFFVDLTCQRCGAVIGVPADRCPNCGEYLPRA